MVLWWKRWKRMNFFKDLTESGLGAEEKEGSETN